MLTRRRWAVARGTLWALDLDGVAGRDVGVASEGPPRVTATFGEARRESAAPVAAAMGLDGPAPARYRFDAGRRCFAAWVEGGIAAYGWVSWGSEYIGELERPIHLPPGEAYVWDCATLPPFRRRGLYGALLRYVAATLGDEGTRRLWIGASLRNRPSIRGFAVAGFRPVVRVTLVRVVAVGRTWVTGEPGAPPALVAAARRALAVPLDA
jgi:GNAT superfamily N-acetyltransferase